jgi:hypothetical protein
VDRPHVMLSSLVVLGLVVCARAEPPRVSFDMPLAVACRNVTSAEYAASNPAHKLIEARFEISSLLVAGNERDLVQYLIRIDSPQKSLTVVDYLPKTLYESRLAGPISVQNTDETSASLGINLSGKYELVTGGFNAGSGEKNASCVKYDLLPPLETIAASGTLDRSSAVFFKLKLSHRQLLEGSRQYALVLRAPADWRFDCLRVRCQADGIRRGVVAAFDEQVIRGRRDFVVALYQEGDEEAKQSAEEAARRLSEQVEGRMSNVEGRSRLFGSNWRLSALPWNFVRR